MIAQPQDIKLTDRPKYAKKYLVAYHPTWCPGCGDFSILSIYFKMMEKRQVPHEKITSIAGIGCSSRFPYFVNAHGAHFLHGRGVPVRLREGGAAAARRGRIRSRPYTRGVRAFNRGAHVARGNARVPDHADGRLLQRRVDRAHPAECRRPGR